MYQFIKELAKSIDKKNKGKELKDAIHEARTKKDTSKLDAVFNSKPKQ